MSHHKHSYRHSPYAAYSRLGLICEIERRDSENLALQRRIAQMRRSYRRLIMAANQVLKRDDCQSTGATTGVAGASYPPTADEIDRAAGAVFTASAPHFAPLDLNNAAGDVPG